MEFLRLEAEDYESALRLARQRWGSAVRIHTRRDLQGGRKGKGCEITFYLVDLSKQQRFKTERHLDRLLQLNGIDEDLPQIIALRQACASLQEAELEMRLIEAILHSIDYQGSFEHQRLVIGGIEQARIAIKVALHLGQQNKQVALISGREEPSIIGELALGQGLSVHERLDLEHSLGYDHIISIEDGGAEGEDDVHIIRVIDAATAAGSLDNLPFCNSLILTNFSAVGEIGPILSAMADSRVPLAFVEDSLEGEQPLLKAGASLFLPKLKGFVLDLDALSF